MKNRTSAALNIYDYPGDLSELTTKLGINPSATFDGTDAINRRRRWSLDSTAPPTAPPEEHITSLITLLKPRLADLAAVAKKYKVVMSLGIDWHEFNPVIVLSPSILKDLSSLGVELWFDMYSYYEGDDE